MTQLEKQYIEKLKELINHFNCLCRIPGYVPGRAGTTSKKLINEIASLEQQIEQEANSKSTINNPDFFNHKIKQESKPLELIKGITENIPELNMANYNYDEVKILNNALIEIYQICHEEQESKTVMDKDKLAEETTEDLKDEIVSAEEILFNWTAMDDDIKFPMRNCILQAMEEYANQFKKK